MCIVMHVSQTKHITNYTIHASLAVQYALYKLTKYCVSAYVVVFLYPPSLCQKLDKHTGFMHHSVSLRTQCFFSHSQSPDTTHSSVCRQCSSVSSLSWANRYFYLCPVSSSGPGWEDEAGYVRAATDVRCRPPFSRAVNACLLRLSRPPLLRWISHGALCSSTTKICLKVDQSCCQRRKRNRNREASEEGGQRACVCVI